MNSKRVISSYDKSADVLYMHIGSVRNVRNIERDDGLILRYDRGTRKPVGATIVDYKECWGNKRHQLITELSNILGVTSMEIERAMSGVTENNAC